MTEAPIRVFLLDDHEIVRRGVAQLVNAEPDMTIVAEAGNARDALNTVGMAMPDVAVLDVRLGDGNGIEVCREISSTYPEVACLVLTSYSDDRAVVDASIAGAKGYVLKQIRGNDLVQSIRLVAKGEVLIAPATVRACVNRLKGADESAVDSLTAQEHKIFDLIGEGYSNREIAGELFLAEKTVKNYVSNMLSKLGMTRRTEAAAFAARLDERNLRKYD